MKQILCLLFSFFTSLLRRDALVLLWGAFSLMEMLQVLSRDLWNCSDLCNDPATPDHQEGSIGRYGRGAIWNPCLNGAQPTSPGLSTVPFPLGDGFWAVFWGREVGGSTNKKYKHVLFAGKSEHFAGHMFEYPNAWFRSGRVLGRCTWPVVKIPLIKHSADGFPKQIGAFMPNVLANVCCVCRKMLQDLLHRFSGMLCASQTNAYFVSIMSSIIQTKTFCLLSRGFFTRTVVSVKVTRHSLKGTLFKFEMFFFIEGINDRAYSSLATVFEATAAILKGFLTAMWRFLNGILRSCPRNAGAC